MSLPQTESPGNRDEVGYASEEPAPEAEPAGYEPGPATSSLGVLADTKVWALLAVRAYLAFVFFEAAVGHLGVPAAVLASQWMPTGVFRPIGDALRSDPSVYIGLVIALEFALALSVTVGLFTRWAGLGGLLLNSFFFAAFEWGDRSQLYLSWDASLAALWLVVLLTGPGQYLGIAQLLGRRFPRLKPWIS